MANRSSLDEDSPIYKEATGIAEYMYSNVLSQFDEFSQERWNTEKKIRDASNNIVFYVAQSVGSSTLAGTEYEWNLARKNLFALRAMYVFSDKQKFLKLAPEIVVRMDNLLVKIDGEIEASKKEIDRLNKEELKPWLEKYKLWHEMNKK
jgi:hypothetical protein